MLRHLALVAALSLAAIACSSSAEDDAAPSCSFVGSYNVTATEEAGGTCGAAGNPTYTISDLGDGTYGLEVPGLQGGCIIEDIGNCKGQGKCDLKLLDATDPANATGGVSFAWTFSRDGFTGSNSLVLPPAKTLPDGCTSRYALTATRL
jgi:hypothetical protein